MRDTVLQNTNPSDPIRRADMDGASASPPVMPNRAQNCFANTQMTTVATAPSMIAALMPDRMTRRISAWFFSPKYVPISGCIAMPTPSITTPNSIRLTTTASVMRPDSP